MDKKLLINGAAAKASSFPFNKQRDQIRAYCSGGIPFIIYPGVLVA